MSGCGRSSREHSGVRGLADPPDDLFEWADRWPDRYAKLERAFWEFHAANPLVYQRLVHYARQWHRAHTIGSIKMLFERVRWDFSIDTATADGFKLNNNNHAFYARLIEDQEPDLKGFFRMRQQRRQASIGPLNRDLPPGEHVS